MVLWNVTPHAFHALLFGPIKLDWINFSVTHSVRMMVFIFPTFQRCDTRNARQQKTIIMISYTVRVQKYTHWLLARREKTIKIYYATTERHRCQNLCIARVFHFRRFLYFVCARVSASIQPRHFYNLNVIFQLYHAAVAATCMNHGSFPTELDWKVFRTRSPAYIWWLQSLSGPTSESDRKDFQ